MSWLKSTGQDEEKCRGPYMALLMSLSSIIVAVNAVLLKRAERDLGKPGAGERALPLQPARAA